jgi:GAF domain-containing protein
LSPDPSPEANEAFVELGTIVLGERPLPQILEQVVHVAARMFSGPIEASITLVAGDSPSTVAFTGDLAIALDERQYEAERGPCLDAAASGETLRVTNLSDDGRWPSYARAAVERGIHSSLSVPLPVQRNVTGALNFYSTNPEGFNEEEVELAQTFAAHAAVAVANAHLYETTATLAEQMRQAMVTRAVIEQAKGIVMAERKCSAADAFDALVRLSQETHMKLRDVAQQLVDQVSGGS